MNLLVAAQTVLAEAGTPLHIKELTQRMLDRNLWSTEGKTPVDSVSSALSVDIKQRGQASIFERTQPGTFGLRAWSVPNGAGDTAPAIPAVPTSAPHGASTASSSPDAKSTVSFVDAAEQVLDRFANRQPMHYREITDRALKLGLIATAGQTPEATMYSQNLLENDRRTKRGEPPRFVKHGKGLVGLAKWQGQGLAAQIDAHNTAIRKRLHARLQSMKPHEFETLIGKLLGALGFANIGVTAPSGDGGIDVRGTLVVGGVIRTRMAVQVKRWKNNVQAPTVQQVRGSLGVHDQGLIITTSDFSKGARQEAEQTDKTPVALMNGEQLVALLVEHNILVRRTSHDLIDLGEDEDEE